MLLKLGIVLLVVIYGIGIWKFWTGFRHTNFSGGRIPLALFWPIMLISKSYRQNFAKALKGG